jgi:hypothetical protein
MQLNYSFLAEEIDCFVDEKGWHRNADDEDETDKEYFEGKTVNVKMPFHAVNRCHLAKRFQPVIE